MLRIEGLEAVEYLEKARGTIHKEDTVFNLPYLSKMLELEALFLQRTMQSGLPEIAGIAIDATGFPEINGWRADLSKIMEQFNNLRGKRELELRPFRQQLLNASPDGIISAGANLAVKLTEDIPLIQAFSGTDDTFKKAVSSEKEPGLPFSKKTSFPGLLFTATPSDPHRLNQGLLKYSKSLEYAFKLVPVFREETVLFCAGIYSGRVNFLNRLDKNQGLASPLSKPEQPNTPQYLPDYSTAFEKNVLGYEQSIQHALLNFDAARFSSSQVDQYLDALAQLNKLIAKSKKFMDAALNCDYQTKEEINSSILEIAGKTNDIYSSLDNDELRSSLQLAMGGSLDAAYGQPKPELQPAQNLALRAPRPVDQKENLKYSARQRLREILEEVKKEPANDKTSKTLLDKALENYGFIESLVNEPAFKNYINFINHNHKFRVVLAGGGLCPWRIDLGSKSIYVEGCGGRKIFEQGNSEYITHFLTVGRFGDPTLLVSRENLQDWWNKDGDYCYVNALGKITKEKLVKTILNKL
ncbi:hypothetical protein HYW46_00460 [Candidatus Daviesbacteria bacterium]|nr:hypothetical protein [Candidatus Daviesbacteria bacterium]